MSATICWLPSDSDGEPESLSCWAPQSFMCQLEEKLNLRPPTSLKEQDLPQLRELAETNCDAGGNPFQEVIEAIEKYKEIVIWPEY